MSTESPALTEGQKQPQQPQRTSPVDAVVGFFSRLVERYLPDPMTIAVLITVLALALAMLVQRVTLFDSVRMWGDGFWNLLAFTMQMTLILLTGYILARTPIVDKLLDKIALAIPGPRAAVATATVIGVAGTYVNWGFGLVVGSLVAQKLAVNVKGLHYPLAIAAGYSGFCIYGIGISGSIPLTIATPGHFLEDQMGVIPTSETNFSLPILLFSAFILVVMPLFNAWLHPKDPAKIVEIDPNVIDAAKPAPLTDRLTVAQRLDRSRIIAAVMGGLAILYAVLYFVDGGTLTLDAVNFLFLFLAILLMGSVSGFLGVLGDAAKVAAGVIVQYPFYAGIMAILAGSGLAAAFSEWFAGISTAESLPFWSFISAGILNMAMPSGGGQWAVQGPIMIDAAQQIGASLPQTAIGVAMGDQWTNAIQPFWILPVLAISKLKLKDVMGFLVLILVFLGVASGVTILLWSFLG